MPCAVDNDMLAELRDRAASNEEFRRRHGLSQTARIVLSVVRFSEDKCVEDLIASFAEPVLRGRRDLHLALVGDGPLRAELEQQVRDLGLEKRVSFLGFLNQSAVVEAMLAADVFSLASNRDPSPKALSEALFLGMPVVCSDGIGTIEGLVEEGGNGEVFPCRDVPALAASLARVLEDDGRMGERSHQIALANDFRVGLDALARKLDESMEGLP
ncbi:MAG: hypothetical protein CL938_02625 [Deltaproteobacteria bacterium]|nr:hypothetical protein [Deltaproteobacteria bacterium]MDP6074849.1 glycosyltransferase [Myxococcota bacterium]MDP6244671.1 glycosyltransferase [Myxococcota bacterium]MDP7075242.1 glycosyltransferase [Myxococcota bacterium]MDP7300924.1 glycosyltransferase [Myxococcota bacterium]